MNFEILPADTLINMFILQTQEGRSDSRGKGLKMEGEPSEICSHIKYISDVLVTNSTHSFNNMIWYP